MQVVNVLGDQDQFVPLGGQAGLQPGERLVRGIGAGGQQGAAAGVVEGVDGVGVAGEGLGRGQLHRVEARPHAALGRVAEGAQPALGGDAGAREHDDPVSARPSHGVSPPGHQGRTAVMPDETRPRPCSGPL